MESGLVSQHAYTVTGAERVRLHGLCPAFLLLETGVGITRLQQAHHSPSPSIHPEVLAPSSFIPQGATRALAILALVSG